MEHLVLGLYVLSLLCCLICLWFWWELESDKEQMIQLHQKLDTIARDLEDTGKKRR